MTKTNIPAKKNAFLKLFPNPSGLSGQNEEGVFIFSLRGKTGPGDQSNFNLRAIITPITEAIIRPRVHPEESPRQ